MSLEERAPEEPGPVESDRIGQLLRLVGPRERAPAEREARVRTVAREVWLDTVRLRERRRQRSWRAGTLALAAALLLALGVGYWNRLETAGGLTPADVPAATVQVSSGMPGFATGQVLPGGTHLDTGSRGRMVLALAGGASVRLDTETLVSLRSPSTLSLDRGAVYVETGAGAAAVEVHTAFGIARDAGTRFEVRVGEGSVRVRVREGEVRFDRGGETHAAGAGFELEVDAAGEVRRGPVDLYGESWEWVLEASPAFRLEGATLEEILDWTSRETGWKIRYRAGAREAVRPLLREVLHGAGPAGARADEMVFQVLMTYGLEARLEDGTLWVEPLH